MKLLHKILSILLPILLLAFTQYPCADRFIVPVSHENTYGIEQLTLKENNSTQHIDLCSPLCACTCCAASITSVILDIDFSTFEITYNCTPTYYKDILQGAYLSIWQPPKII